MSNNQQQKPTFTIVEVTGDILNLRLEGVLHVHFIDMGAVANTGNQLQDAANSGKRKNHVIFQFDIHKDDQTETWRTIHLSMDMDMNLQDVASDEAQAPQSIRSSLSSRSSFNDIEERPVTVPPSIASAGSDHADAVEAPANGSDASSLTGNASYSYDIEPSSQSGGGADIIEGAPAPGQLYIKVRDYGEPFSTLKSFSFALKGTPQLWRFVEAIASRDMQLFSFRKLNFSFFGCRDFIIQSYYWFVEENLIDEFCVENHDKSLYDIIRWRYTPVKTQGVNSLSDSDSAGSQDSVVREALRRIPSPVDHGEFSDYQRVLSGRMRMCMLYKDKPTPPVSPA